MSLPDGDAVIAAARSREFWRGVLLAGGFTSIPRWTLDPVPGVAEHEAKIGNEVVAALRRFADELAVPLSSVLLTAHAKVLGALSGEREVSTGCSFEGRSPLLCRFTTEPHSWRAMLLEADRVQSELLAHKDLPVEDLRLELGLIKPLFETVFALSAGDGAELPEETVLRVAFVEQDGLVLRLRYRTDVLDADCARRIAGYYDSALALMIADPDAEHARQTLLAAEELRFQLNGLAGPRRNLPNCRAHELFEDRAHVHPDAIAAEHGNRQWTYRELNAHANQLARALLTRGLSREAVVAVVTERNLDWMAAVLAIFKAGGAYLPIEPHFPADRIARTLSRAACRVVLTERGSTTLLDQAIDSLSCLRQAGASPAGARTATSASLQVSPKAGSGPAKAGVQTLFIDALYEEAHYEDDPSVPVAPDQLAYIYFTSGSTGEPKGAMCEHAGMLNHLFAKIDDLRIDEGDVVAQTAPQCFDISLWQLLSALLVGGQTLLVEQETVLDARRFIDKIVDGRVNVVQVVPSYLEVLLSYLAQHPRALPDLRCVSATGEALKKELVQRWFAIQPGIKLMNAYGLTETSDDTNHEVMERVPERDRVPLGSPVNNVSIYVVDENLSPVPLGAPGEIVFSGVCVGRGYINDPERTAQGFLADPHRAGQRLYRSGDYGRWLPEGKLEFLGRRDAQVKISGFRIEIGEIENALLRLPGVREAAVVVIGGTDQSKHLVAFYTAQHPLDANVLQDQFRESLPTYMVPSACHWQRNLPLTGNGKIDRKALMALAGLGQAGAVCAPGRSALVQLPPKAGFGPAKAGKLDSAQQGHDRPSTATEQRLAAAWAEVLGIPKDQIGRRDHFFELGGTSLSALKLAITLERAVSFKDLNNQPILADLATLVDERIERNVLPAPASVPGAVPRPPKERSQRPRSKPEA